MSVGKNLFALVVLLAAAGGGAYYWYSQNGLTLPAFFGGSESPRAARGPAARVAVPVSVAIADRRDMPIYVTGLGNVQAVATVGIHSQVDGKLQEVLFTEGQRVKRGDILAKIDPRLFQASLDQAKAKRAQDEAQLVAAQKDLIRFKALVAKNFETEQNVDLQTSKVDQLKATIAADAAMIESAQTQLDYTTITAPHDGRIGVRLVDAGNIVHASDQNVIATLVSMQPATVLFTLPARELDAVRSAQEHGSIEVVAYDQDNAKALSTGKLSVVDNVIDQTTSQFRLKAVFPNEDDKLWPGEFVNARVLLEMRANVVAVPSTAVQRGPQGLFTWVVSPNNTVSVRPIEVGPTTGNLTIITSGVNNGDVVVTDGQYKLQPNAPVTYTPATTASTRSAT